MNKSSNITVIKIGGSTLGETDSTFKDIITLYKRGWKFIIVHGGGKEISSWINKQGIEPNFVEGLRVTDQKTLEVAVAVLAGKVNSEIVTEFQNMKVNAIGLSGSSGILEAKQLDEKLGFVGEIVNCNVDVLMHLVDNGFLPIVSPLAISIDKKNQIYNANADTAAGIIANKIKAENIIFQTDVPGIMDANKRVIPQMTKVQANELIESGIAQGGMIPKIRACINALEYVKTGRIIDGRESGALLSAFTNDNIGTRII
tara:strand:+ start:959 stop:1732 length:774 start_codon:yes stop_codon:yes gene_type:complete